MRIEFEHSDNNLRGYTGLSVKENECREYLQGKVKDILLDKKERGIFLNRLLSLEQDTGFKAGAQLLADIKALEDETVDVQTFRVGEAYAEAILSENFSCRFYWNELRDTRNPWGNKTGADLIGFIKIDNKVLFLFGEVKTSSEKRRPPQVMKNKDGMENQLRDLYFDSSKRLVLISYLQNKARLSGNEQFQNDLNASIKSYYKNVSEYQLIGVLVRDIEPDEKDLLPSYDKLKSEILKPTGLRLIAFYVPIAQGEWLKVINKREEK